MTPATLLADLTAAGFALRPGPAGKLLVSPASKLTAAQRGNVAGYRTELLALLSAPVPKVPAPRLAGTLYTPEPFDPVAFRERLEAFWATGWTPVGGWRPGDRTPPPTPASAACPAAGGGR